MTPSKRELPIRRILVPLDASPHSLAALETAAELASRLGAELVGLFVEDINLLRLTEIPFAREISYFSSEFRRLELPELERQFRAQAALMRRLLADIAEREGIPWDFHTRRGAVAEEIMNAGLEADMMILGRVGRTPLGARHMGSTVRYMVLKRRGFTLIMRQGTRITVPVVTLYDGSEAARNALYAAMQLVKTVDSNITVLILGGDREDARRLQREALDQLAAHGLGADFRLLVDPPLSRIIHMIRMESTGPVVLPCSRRQQLDEEALCQIIDEIPNAVMLVRS